jgi:uncharacterized membrane protein YwzB
MKLLLRLYGWPHEALHVLALWLIGRRPEAITSRHVDIPADLSTREYVFVAGFPALAFWSIAAISLRLLLAAPDLAQVALWLIIATLSTGAAFSTFGDLQLIAMRLMGGQDEPQ